MGEYSQFLVIVIPRAMADVMIKTSSLPINKYFNNFHKNRKVWKLPNTFPPISI